MPAQTGVEYPVTGQSRIWDSITGKWCNRLALDTNGTGCPVPCKQGCYMIATYSGINPTTGKPFHGIVRITDAIEEGMNVGNACLIITYTDPLPDGIKTVILNCKCPPRRSNSPDVPDAPALPVGSPIGFRNTITSANAFIRTAEADVDS